MVLVTDEAVPFVFQTSVRRWSSRSRRSFRRWRTSWENRCRATSKTTAMNMSLYLSRILINMSTRFVSVVQVQALILKK